MKGTYYLYVFCLAFGAVLGGCAGCDTHPVRPGITDPGGAPGVDPCDLACEHAATLGCPQAQTEGGVTCSELCRQVPVLRDSAKCAATAGDCAAFDTCSATPDGG